MIKDVVGAKTYSVWTDMLKRLVPGGRTHRLSVVAAGMLQVAYEIAGEKEKASAKAGKLAELMQEALEGGSDDGLTQLTGLAEEPFKDAGVGFRRSSRRGEGCSIAEDAAPQQFGTGRLCRGNKPLVFHSVRKTGDLMCV